MCRIPLLLCLNSQPKSECQGVLDPIENWLRSKASRYKYILIVITAAIVPLAGWILDRTLLRKAESSKAPEISIYNDPIEDFSPTIQSYYQYPQYKKGEINFGGSFGPTGYYLMTPVRIGENVFLMFKIDGEVDMRTFNLSQMPNVPFSIQLKIKGEGFLVTVEKIEEDGIQVRTFQSKGL